MTPSEKLLFEWPSFYYQPKGTSKRFQQQTSFLKPQKVNIGQNTFWGAWKVGIHTWLSCYKRTIVSMKNFHNQRPTVVIKSSPLKFRSSAPLLLFSPNLRKGRCLRTVKQSNANFVLCGLLFRRLYFTRFLSYYKLKGEGGEASSICQGRIL